MIPKQKTQLFKQYQIGNAIFYLAILAGFFLCALLVRLSFFYVLSAGALGILILLWPMRARIRRIQANFYIASEAIQEKINLVESDLDAQEIAAQAFREKIINFSQLKGLTEKLSMCLYVEDTSRMLSSEVNRLFGSSETTIILYLFHTRTGELGLSSSQKGQMRIHLKSKKGDIFDRWVVKTMQSLLVSDVRSDFRFDVEKLDVPDNQRPIRSIISVPLIGGDKALGILRVDSPKENHFTTEDLRFLTTIGDLGAIAIENAQLYERLEQMAIRDGLTGLYLRKYLLERMTEEIARHLRSKSAFSFLMMDIDKFKEYNDNLGHMAGDIVLRTLGMILTDFFADHPGSVICRYGGEEFCVLIPHCGKKDAAFLAEMLRKKIETQPVLLRREKTKVTVSIGVACFPEDAALKEDVIRRADQALYEAKHKGRNRVVLASDKKELDQ